MLKRQHSTLACPVPFLTQGSSATAKPAFCLGLEEALALPMADGNPDVLPAGKELIFKNPIVCNEIQFSLESNYVC